MEDFEKLGAFYLGRPYELATKSPKDGILLYDSKDLVTHAVCVGMTGSGKTGLCIALLEEAAIDGIPAIVIDPKGDLSNLLLTFPELQAKDFQPWVNAEDAEKKGLSVEQFAAQQAEFWAKGLADWGQDKTRIQRLKNAADFRIYTPGSNSGFPISILNSFAAPPAEIRDDNELLNERVSTTVTSLLGLLGLEADPIKSREHILLSNIINKAWSNGTDLDLAALIQQIQSPPITKVGVMDLESFFPSNERFELAMLLNNLLAAPSFSSWLEGESLEIQNLLYQADGKPRIAIFSIAHLSDAERMFFVSLLLNQTLGWIRAQSGTTSLRAILYMDEIFGYFPPVANPPAKRPLMTLLKQGRAFGLGVVLATQNPVDLDYKGLANTGTWFIGRLQTERDKARVIEGLEGVATGSGHGFDRQKTEQLIAGLGNRVFLMNNVHDDASEIFQTRWAMSYLRGPLTRTQIKQLMEPVKGTSPQTQPAPKVATPPPPGKAVESEGLPSSSRPVLKPEISQHFIPSRAATGTLIYQPMVLGVTEVHFSDKKHETTETMMLLAPLSKAPIALDWATAIAAELHLGDLQEGPEVDCEFAALPDAATKPKSYDSWRKDLVNWIYRNKRCDVFLSKSLGVYGQSGESERDFRVRLLQFAREKRDEAVERLRLKYAPKIANMEDKRRRAADAVSRESEQAKSEKTQTAVSFGATLLSSFLGRKSLSLSTLGRATTAARGVGRSMKEAEDVDRAQETLETMNQRLAALNEEFRNETAELEQLYNPETVALETYSLKPKKSDITVKLLALVWAPFSRDANGQATAAWK